MKNISYLVFIFSILVTLRAFAETSVQSYIKSMPNVQVSDKGGVFLPPAVYKAMGSNQVSDVQQFALAQNIMNSCVRKVISAPFDQRTPYVEAAKAFENGKCRISRCYQQAMLVSLLPMLVGNKAGGGSTQALMAQALQGSQSDTCAGSGPAFDSGLVNFVKASIK